MIVRWARAVGALVLLVLIVVGVPLVVIVVAGWPLPGKVPDWDHVVRMVRQGEIPADPVIKTLAIVVWLAWAQVAWALVWELFVNVPAQVAGRPLRSSAPLVASPVSSAVGRLVAVILAVGLFTAATPAAARTPLVSTPIHRGSPAAEVVLDRHDSRARQAAATARAPVPADRRWVATDTDTMWDVAETVFGDGSRVGELLELNPHIGSARQLRPGQVIIVPAGATIPESRRPTSATTFGSEPDEPDSTAEAHTITIEIGDTLWDLSADHLAEVGADTDPTAVADYVEQVVADNPDVIEDPNLIFAGEQVLLPEIEVEIDVVDGTATPAPDESTQATESADVPTVAPATIYTVVAGDTLWDILDAHYGHVDADLVWHVAEANDLQDPNMIIAGQQLQLPTDPTAAVPAAPSPPIEESSPPISPEPVDDPAPGPSPESPTPPTGAPEPVTPPPAPSAPSTTAPPPTAPPTTVPASAPTPTVVPTTDSPTIPATSAPAASVGEETDVTDDDLQLFDVSTRTLWWQVPMGLLLANGLVAMMRRLRFRRLARLEPGEQLAKAPPVAAGTELAATTVAAPASRMATLQTLLRTLTPHAREHDDPPPVRAVEVHDDRVSVLFASPAPFPPSGWLTVDGGRSWEHKMVEGATTPVRQLVTPTLVTVGHRDGGGEVLLDVETAASVALVGDRAATLGVARSMTLELATYPLGVPIDVCPIGFAVDGIEDCDRAWPNTTLTRAVRVARQMLDRTAATGAVSLMAARAAIDDDDGTLDPHVFVVDVESVVDTEQSLLDELVSLCQPQSGAAAILIGGHRDAREVIEVASATSATWSGVRLRPPIVDREAAAQVAVMFDHVAHAPAEPLAMSPVIADLIAAEGDTADRDDTQSARKPDNSCADDSLVDYRYEPPEYDVLVRLLGEVTVEGRDITSADDIELLALLVCMRDRRPNIDTIATHLIRDKKRSATSATASHPAAAYPLRTMQQRVGKLRTKLGVAADGSDLLPTAATGRGSPGRYQVSPRVMTDVELIEHRFQTSLTLASGDALAVLRDGLKLFTGPAFRARKGYDWAATESVLVWVYNVINAYATRLMALSFDSGDIALVLATAQVAGHVIDDPIAELPMRNNERKYADVSGNPDLAASVAEARRRLINHVSDSDALATDDL